MVLFLMTGGKASGKQAGRTTNTGTKKRDTITHRSRQKKKMKMKVEA
jgi:hypothetical protein